VYYAVKPKQKWISSILLEIVHMHCARHSCLWSQWFPLTSLSK